MRLVVLILVDGLDGSGVDSILLVLDAVPLEVEVVVGGEEFEVVPERELFESGELSDKVRRDDRVGVPVERPERSDAKLELRVELDGFEEASEGAIGFDDDFFVEDGVGEFLRGSRERAKGEKVSVRDMF